MIKKQFAVFLSVVMSLMTIATPVFAEDCNIEESIFDSETSIILDEDTLIEEISLEEVNLEEIDLEEVDLEEVDLSYSTIEDEHFAFEDVDYAEPIENKELQKFNKSKILLDDEVVEEEGAYDIYTTKTSTVEEDTSSSKTFKVSQNGRLNITAKCSADKNTDVTMSIYMEDDTKIAEQSIVLGTENKLNYNVKEGTYKIKFYSSNSKAKLSLSYKITLDEEMIYKDTRGFVSRDAIHTEYPVGCTYESAISPMYDKNSRVFCIEKESKVSIATITDGGYLDAAYCLYDMQGHTLLYGVGMMNYATSKTISLPSGYYILKFYIPNKKDLGVRYMINAIEKKGQTIKIKTTSKTLDASKVKKSTQSFKIKSTSKTKITYKKTKGNSKITVSKNGTVKVKKGLKAGTYKIKVKASAPSNDDYKAATKTFTLKIVVSYKDKLH